jgi:putative ABC transport system permease protein
MFKNFLRVAWRRLSRNKAYSFINIAGLSLGMSIALLIGLWIADEYSFDYYHLHHDRIAELMIRQQVTGKSDGGTLAAGQVKNTTSASISTVIGTVLRKGYEDVFLRTALAAGPMHDRLFNYGDHSLSGQAMWVQPAFTEIFTYHMLAGTASSLRDASTLLLAHSAATALFGKADPIGKVIRYNNNLDLRVGGVYEDQPFNSSFYHVLALLPWDNKAAAWLNRNTNWNNHNSRLFVQLADGVTPEQATARIKNLPTPHVTEYVETLLAYPLDRLHLHDEFHGDEGRDRIRFVWLFGTIGTFILLLACINFMNLSTARSEKRAREVGIRKTIGSLRGQLIFQFLGESILTALLAFTVAMTLAYVALPAFNQLAGKETILPLYSPAFWASALGFVFFTGILAGSYPAFYLSAFRPVQVLKGLFRAGHGSSLSRQVLVVTQFTVSLSLIIATLIIFRQIELGQDRPVGYNREGLITIDINTDSLRKHFDALRNDLLQTSLVANVAESSYPTTGFWDGNELEWAGQTSYQKDLEYRNVTVTPEFGKTIGWTLRQGRDLSREYSTDSDAMVINEEAQKLSGFRDPIGQRVQLFDRQYTIIGVVNNMLTNSPYEKIEPAVFTERGYVLAITLRVRAGKPMRAALAAIEPIFKRYNPASPFLYHFNDEVYAQKFAEESRIGNLATVAASLAIFISCLGLFGLASFLAEQRTREIGVRKVLGAGVFGLWALLSRDFVKLVVLSMFIAIPLAYWFMQQWLQNYKVHTNIPWWILGMAGGGTFFITLLTVSFQSIKAAMMNPIKSLRTE